MLRIAAFAGLVLAALSVHAQFPGEKPTSENKPAQINKPYNRPFDGNTSSPRDRSDGIMTAPSRLTETEKGVFYKAFGKDATPAQKLMANDVCTKKCQPCHNGVECNFECVKKSDCLK